MGLDMYLVKKKKTQEIKDIEDLWELGDIAYWRKANQVHNYFCTYGEELSEQRIYRLDEDILRDLLKRCIEIQNIAEITEGLVQNGSTYVPEENKFVPNMEKGRTIKNQQDIAEILPTCSGFFFGSTDYDEWYMRDIENTEEQIRNILESTDFENEEIYYLASW